MLKGYGQKDQEASLLHINFVQKLAECKTDEDFKSLANEIKNVFTLPQGLQTATNLVKFKQIMYDYATFCQDRFQSEMTARRIRQIADFATGLAQNGSFRSQLYENAAAIFALLEQGSQSLLIHFDSLLTLGDLTINLARLYKWDEDYIERVQNLYQSDEHDAQTWMAPFNTYLQVKHDYKNAAAYFKLLMNESIKPDQKFNLKRVTIEQMPSRLLIKQNDLKMMTMKMDLIHVPGTIHSLERTYSISEQAVDDDHVSTVEEILRNVFYD